MLNNNIHYTRHEAISRLLRTFTDPHVARVTLNQVPQSKRNQKDTIKANVCDGEIIWKDGPLEYYDSSVVNPLADSNIQRTRTNPLQPLIDREAAKNNKYKNSAIPLVVDTFGNIGVGFVNTLNAIAASYAMDPPQAKTFVKLFRRELTLMVSRMTVSVVSYDRDVPQRTILARLKRIQDSFIRVKYAFV